MNYFRSEKKPHMTSRVGFFNIGFLRLKAALTYCYKSFQFLLSFCAYLTGG